MGADEQSSRKAPGSLADPGVSFFDESPGGSLVDPRPFAFS
jgi:hypothetical protein